MQGKRSGAALVAAAALFLHSIVPGQTSDAHAGVAGTESSEAAFGWERVLTPTTMNLNGVFGSATLAAAVGAGGVGLLFDGEEWNLVSTPTQLPLEAVWAASRDEIFAVGASGNIFRFSLDGDVERMQSGTAITLRAVWGRSADDVYAAGDNGTMLHFDGKEWTYELVPTVNVLRGIAVTNGGDVYVVGDFGKIFRRDEGDWVLKQTGTTLNLNAVWALADDDVFAVGARGILSEPHTDYKTIARKHENCFIAGEGDTRVLSRNRPDEIEAMVRSMVETAHMTGGYFMRVGNEFTWRTPPEAIKLYLDLCNKLAHR